MIMFSFGFVWCYDILTIVSYLIPNSFYMRYIVIYMFMQHHNDIIIKTDAGSDKDAGRLLYKNIYLSLYCKGSKGLFKFCV